MLVLCFSWSVRMKMNTELHLWLMEFQKKTLITWINFPKEIISLRAFLTYVPFTIIMLKFNKRTCITNLFWIFPFSWCSDKSISLGLFEGFGAVKSIRVLEEFENDFGDLHIHAIKLSLIKMNIIYLNVFFLKKKNSNSLCHNLPLILLLR